MNFAQRNKKKYVFFVLFENWIWMNEWTNEQASIVQKKEVDHFVWVEKTAWLPLYKKKKSETHFSKHRELCVFSNIFDRNKQFIMMECVWRVMQSKYKYRIKSSRGFQLGQMLIHTDFKLATQQQFKLYFHHTLTEYKQ